jgi:hypothetical protein
VVLVVPSDPEEPVEGIGTPVIMAPLSNRTLRRILICLSSLNSLTAFLASLAVAYCTVALPFDFPVTGSLYSRQQTISPALPKNLSSSFVPAS